MNSLILGAEEGDPTQRRWVRVDALGRVYVIGVLTVISPTVTVDTNIYAAGDSVGGKLTLTSAVPVSGGFAELKNITITDESNQKPALEILFFNADPSASTFTNNAAVVIHANDIGKICGRQTIAAGDWVTVDTKGIAMVSVSKILKATTGTSLYAALVATGTPTFVAATDLTMKFSFEQK